MYQESAIKVELKLTVMDCANCGIVFGVTDELVARRRKDGGTFYCPQGHANVYTNTENLRLKHQLDQEQAARRRAEQELLISKRELKTAKAAHTRDLKRIHAGVCTDCHRHFVNLERHMVSKHHVDPVTRELP